MDELGYLKLELGSLIGGREISKAVGFWAEDDGMELDLFKRIADLLKRIEPQKEVKE